LPFAQRLVGTARGVGFGGVLYGSLLLTSLLSIPVLFSEKAIKALTMGVTWFMVPASLKAGGIEVTGSGQEHAKALEKTGYILIANHASNLDPLALMSVLGRRDLAFVAKVETLRRPLLGRIIASIPWLPVERESLAALKKLTELVRAKQKTGWVPILAVFPEGTRTETGALNAFKVGPFMLAAQLGIPILPAVIRGTFPRHKRNAFMVFPGPVRVDIHPPIFPPKLEGKALDLKVVDAAAALKKQAEAIFKAVPDLTDASDAATQTGDSPEKLRESRSA
jgi:1-acyl-sn-glycerol-3-phosphate acyltransferase